MLMIMLFGLVIVIYVLYFSLRKQPMLVYILVPVLGCTWAYAFTAVNPIEDIFWRWVTVIAIGLLHLQSVIIMLRLLKKVES